MSGNGYGSSGPPEGGPAAAAAAGPVYAGAGVLIFVQRKDDIYILFGFEGKHVSDVLEKITDKKGVDFTIESLEVIQNKASVDEAKKSAFNRAVLIEESLKHPVHYTQLIQDRTTPTTFHTKYVFYEKGNPQHKRGIVKGRLEGAESPMDVIIREAKEEIQFDISSLPYIKDLIDVQNYKIYFVPIENATAEKDLIPLFETLDKQKYGELFDIKFVPLAYVVNPKSKFAKNLNFKTHQAIAAFLKRIKFPDDKAKEAQFEILTPKGGARRKSRRRVNGRRKRQTKRKNRKTKHKTRKNM